MMQSTVATGIVFLSAVMSLSHAFVRPSGQWGDAVPIAPSRRALTSLVHQPTERDFSASIVWDGGAAASLSPWTIWNDNAVVGESIAMNAISAITAPGTRMHLFNALLATSIPLIFSLWSRSFHVPLLSRAIFWGTFAGISMDHLVFAAGKHIGEGDVLRELTRLRIVLHVLALPSLLVPIIETAIRSRLIPFQHGNIAKVAALSVSFIEVMYWLFSYDTRELSLVDNRESKSHTPRVMAGTLSYTSGPSKIVKMMIPVAVLQLSLLTVGYKLWARSIPAGSWLLIASLQSILSNALQRPDIQAFGETANIVLMWAGLASASC